MAMRKAGETSGKGRGPAIGRAADTGRFEVKKAGRLPKSTIIERIPAPGRGEVFQRYIGADGKVHERPITEYDVGRPGMELVTKVRKATVVTRATLKQSGGSLIFTVPAPARKAMDFKPGDEIELTVGDGRMIVEPAPVARKRPKYSLDELLAQCDPNAPISDDERAWLDEPPVGREFW